MRQRRGLLVLSGLLILVVVGRTVWTMQKKDAEIGLSPLDVQEQTSPTQQVESKKENQHQVSFPPKKTMPPAQSIDLNTATDQELGTLPGIGPTFSKRIVKFRDAMGGFDSIGQLKKVYGLPPETYESLKGVFYLSQKQKQKQASSTSDKQNERRFDSSAVTSIQHTKPKAQNTYQITDLNAADSAALDALPGLGPVLSRRIVNFRKRLGYFAYPEMLKLVYGLSEENYQKAKPWLTASLPESKPHSLKSASWNDLKVYPFLKKSTINAIITQQRSGTFFTSWEEVATLPEMNAQTLKWLKGYVEL